MTYSACAYMDDINSALHVSMPGTAPEQPSDVADLAIAEIERLQKIEKSLEWIVTNFKKDWLNIANQAELEWLRNAVLLFLPAEPAETEDGKGRNGA